MSQDQYRAGPERMLGEYPCGVKAGDRLRLRGDFPVRDHKDRLTGKVFRRGSMWTVVYGIASEPNVVWLHQPDGQLHTWDETVIETFELAASAPVIGSTVILCSLPPRVNQLPVESRRLFELCLRQPLMVAEIDSNGLVVLDASKFDAEIGGTCNDVRVEAELVLRA